MKARYSPHPRVEFEIESDSAKEIFKKMAELAETFGVSECGHCASQEIYPIVREVDGNFFFEMKCRKCFHKLSFGQSKDQKTIYPRLRYHKQSPEVKARRTKEGDYIPHAGWEKFVSNEHEQG